MNRYRVCRIKYCLHVVVAHHTLTMKTCNLFVDIPILIFFYFIFCEYSLNIVYLHNDVNRTTHCRNTTFDKKTNSK